MSAALAACGSGSVTPVPVVSPGPTTSPDPSQGITGLKVSVGAAVLDVVSGQGGASLNFSGAAGLSAQALTLSVVSAPAGLTVQTGTPSSTAGSVGVTLNVRASGAVSSGTLILKAALGTQTQTISVPLLIARLTDLPAVGGSTFKPATSVTCPDGDVYLSAPVNAVMEQRTRLLRLNAASGAFDSFDLNLALTEGVTSQLCTPAGDLWLSVRSDAAQGSVIAHLHRDTGTVERFAVGATADTINNLTRTPDGRLWFVQYKHDRLGEFDPASGTVTSHAVTDNAENLTLGQDGDLYFSRFYTDPAVVRYDPASGSSTVLSAGTTNRNLPRAIVQTQGVVWYVDAWTQQLLRVDPASGKPVAISLPTGAAPGELVAAPDGTIWVADAGAHVLYRLAPGSTDAVTVPLLGGSSDGPRALSVGSGGVLWYESGGHLIDQQ
ncbi:hypothetical protein MF271_11380 [Deinococcus sp. KNUC1210]|uniref:Vgb family protein n=1 Tax=Deinococcus sp. KNUC1210 TaxID=2917691 RepID=UPI001EEF89BE|nr:hypothetical protein [Deinococcus sp. KNUC1210]ULH14613.1 hypothetical protein MF271_11380 [Deinococcus sp. KNUC1210]